MADKVVNRGIKIWIDGKEVPKNVGAIRNEIKALIKDQNKMTIGAEDYVRSGKKIAYLNSILAEHKAKTAELSKEYKSLAQRTKDAFGGVSSWFNRNLAVAGTLIATITGASLAFRKLAEDVAKMDDVYSDVMKTTGMTRNEVVSMNNEFKKFDTRTSREELNKIAEAGGRIGIAKENIIDFTRAINIANVALGDSFTGGVEEISTKLGKLKMLFQETKDMQVEQAYLSIGSAINELGANGAASEPNIANFALRVGSLPDALKPSIAETLALGAAFEESGIEAEISGRAYSIFLKQASTRTASFAEVMGTTVENVKELINTNPLEFFLQFSKGLKGMNATETSQILHDLKLNADGVNKIIGAAANSTDRFRELVDLSNKSFTEGTSVINEYNIKNNNLAAELEKARKSFKETSLELGEKLNPLLLKSTKGTTYLIRAMIELPKWLRENKGLIVTLAVVMGVYTLAVNKARIELFLKNAQLKLSTFYLVSNKAANLAAAAAQAFFTGNIVRARIAMQIFNKTVGLNPYILLAAGIAAVTVGIYKLISGFNRLNEQARAVATVNKEVAVSTARERAELNLLLKTARNENLSKETRIKAIQKLNEISPKYLGGLSLENINAKKATTAINDYTDALMANARQKAVAENITKLYADKFKNEAEIAELDVTIENDKGKGFWRSNKLSQSSWRTRQSMLANRNKNIDQRLSIYEDMSTNMGGYTGGNNIGNTGTGDDDDTDDTFNVPDDKSGSKETKAQKERKKLNAKMLELEMLNYGELAKLKQYYINDDKKTEEQYNQELIDQQSIFLEKKKAQLEDLLPTITDPEVQADVKKQIETTNNDLLDLDVNYRNQVLANLKKEQDDSLKLSEDNAEKRKQIFEKYGINELTSQKDAEFAIIDEYEKLGILSHEDALRIKAALDDEYLKDEIDKRLEGYQEVASSVANIFGDLNGAMNNLMSAEENRTSVKYDKQIKAARKAGRDTTQLEEKKEEAIAKIRAKNADKQFVLTIASVIASTAMAAIDAYANAVKIPIVGLALAPIAAAAAVAFGASQIAVAKQQRDAAKEGYFMGGFTGGDDPRQVRGYFPDGQPYHGKEFVVNHRGVTNPNIRPVLDAFDVAQRTGTINTLSKQDIARALNLNSTSSASSSGSASSRDPYIYETINRLAQTVERLSNQIDEGIPAIATISGERGIAKKLDEFNKLTKQARG